jgi:hypothetical protein
VTKRTKAIGKVGALAILSLWATSQVAAYETRLNDNCTVTLHWPLEKEVQFWLSTNGCGGLPFERCEAAVKAAVDTIQNI